MGDISCKWLTNKLQDSLLLDGRGIGIEQAQESSVIIWGQGSLWSLVSPSKTNPEVCYAEYSQSCLQAIVV